MSKEQKLLLGLQVAAQLAQMIQEIATLGPDISEEQLARYQAATDAARGRAFPPRPRGLETP